MQNIANILRVLAEILWSCRKLPRIVYPGIAAEDLAGERG